jgi:hypothetical protein
MKSMKSLKIYQTKLKRKKICPEKNKEKHQNEQRCGDPPASQIGVDCSRHPEVCGNRGKRKETKIKRTAERRRCHGVGNGHPRWKKKN